MNTKKALYATAALCLAAVLPNAHGAISNGSVKIGVIGDLSGILSEVSGRGSLVAATLAVEAYGGKVAGMPIEIVQADHQNKADIAANTVRKWFDVDGVDMVTDLVNSSVALAVSQLGREKNKVVLVTGAGVSELTGKACTPNTIHWTYDTDSISRATTNALVKSGMKSWYFLTADYAFGTSMQRDATTSIEANGGKVVGSIRHPVNPADFSSFLLTAQQSKAQVIALANAGKDLVNTVKQAAEFGVGKDGSQRLAGLLVTLTDVKAMGLKNGQGLVVTSPFYWDREERTRAFATEFAKRNGGSYPTMMQAGVYSAILHYLKSVEALKSDDDGAAVVAKMKQLPTDDPMFGQGSIRKDGRKLHAMYVYQVKRPEESRGPWDLYKQISTVKAEDAFQPMAERDCAFVKQ